MDDSEDDIAASKLAQITPGRIRASRMGNSKRNNFVKSPSTTGQTAFDLLNTTPLNQPPKRAMTRPKHPNIENIDNEKDSNDAEDYNVLLPAVKVQRKKKKASPTSNSNRGGDSYMEIPTGHHRNHHHPSTSRMSTSGMKRTEPKLRPTLD